MEKQKYLLINIETKEEFLCEKVVVDGFDYYVSNDIPANMQLYYDKFLHKILLAVKVVIKDDIDFENRIYYTNDGRCSRIENCKKVIATTNPSLDIPKVVDEVEEMANKRYNINYGGSKLAFKNGYNQAKQEYKFTEKDMIEFARFVSDSILETYTEDFELWKSKQPIKVYFK